MRIIVSAVQTALAQDTTPPTPGLLWESDNADVRITAAPDGGATAVVDMPDSDTIATLTVRDAVSGDVVAMAKLTNTQAGGFALAPQAL